MADTPNPLRKGYYVDEDGDYDALDKPQPVYGPHRQPTTWEDIDRHLAAGDVAEIPHHLFEQLRAS